MHAYFFGNLLKDLFSLLPSDSRFNIKIFNILCKEDEFAVYVVDMIISKTQSPKWEALPERSMRLVEEEEKEEER